MVNLVLFVVRQSAFLQTASVTPSFFCRFYDPTQLSWSSCPKTDKDLAYWRRRGQDFSILLGCTDKGNSEMKGMATPRPLYGHDKESQWEGGGGTENARRTVSHKYWKPPGDHRWQSLRTEGWNQPTKFEGLLSEADRERLLQEMCSARQGDAAVTSRNKGKSQSLPRVLSPGSLRFVESPSVVNSNHSLSATKAISCPQTEKETPKHNEPAAHVLPLPKPKYGRPLKPPSYELHRQTKGTLETHSLQDDQRQDEAISYMTKVNEPSLDACIPDSGLEPPVYIPPPCYKSPAVQSMTRHLPNEVPEYNVCFNNGMQQPVERTILSYPSLASTFKTEDKDCKDEQVAPDKKSHPRPLEGYLSSVQYIPFDDPRIRHIKIVPTDGLQEDVKVTEDANKMISPDAFQESSLEPECYDGAFLARSDVLHPAVECDQLPGSSPHRSGQLAEFNVGQDNCALLIQRDSHDAGNDFSHKYPKGRLSAQSPQVATPYETVTKVKKFEPGTEIQSKRNSKKKMNETIFCLVSIPVKSELNLTDTDRNNNLTQGTDEKNGFDNSGVLQEQSLLSTSSTDLELQALTGNMTSKNELQKQELWRPEFKQMNDLMFLPAAKHKELQYSGSWPGDQYKDQQTQTSFMEEPKALQHLHNLQPSGSSEVTTSKLLGYATPTPEPKPAVLLADDRKFRQDAFNVKGQGYFDTSSNSMVPPRNVGITPQMCQKPPSGPCTTIPEQGRETSSALREEGSASCSSKELFGQFLLKPVSRRPWDIISELESFNKELQEQEESSEDGVENEGKREGKEESDGRHEIETCKIERLSRDEGPTRQHSLASIPVVPVLKQGKGSIKSESFGVSESSSTGFVSHGFPIGATSLSRLQAKEMGESDRYVATHSKNQDIDKRIIKQVVSEQQAKNVLSGSPSDENHYNPFNSIDFREESQVTSQRDNIVHFDRLNKNIAPRNNLAFERGSVIRLSLTNKNQGLSEPDLRSVGLIDDERLGSPELDCNGKPIVHEIPPNESLQDRAARILGIDIAVESLVPNDRTPQGEQHSFSDNITQNLELSVEKALSSEVETKVSSYERRLQSGWTVSTLFVRDRNVLQDQNNSQGTLLATQPVHHHKGLGRQEKDQTPRFESSGLSLAEKKLVLPSIEKRSRSTSKVIETLQGKLATPPSRAAMDRLVRMKEVDSVSRMRRLSIKNMESIEVGEEDRPSKRSEEQGSSTFGGNEAFRKMAHSSSVSKRVISLVDNDSSGNMSEKKTGRDLCCLGKI